jgi:hypothetical protein
LKFPSAAPSRVAFSDLNTERFGFSASHWRPPRKSRWLCIVIARYIGNSISRIFGGVRQAVSYTRCSTFDLPSTQTAPPQKIPTFNDFEKVLVYGRIRRRTSLSSSSDNSYISSANCFCRGVSLRRRRVVRRDQPQLPIPETNER